MKNLSLECLSKALGAMRDERDATGGNRELSIAMTHLDTAILWQRENLANQESMKCP